MSARKVLAGLSLAAVASVSGCGGRAASYTPADPVGVRQCIAAWVELHDDGWTASALAKASAGDSRAVAAVLAVKPADLSAAAVCGTLGHADDEYVIERINARTGDDYHLVGKAVR